MGKTENKQNRHPEDHLQD